MNLSQVKELKAGDLVEFIHSFPAFTVGKKYKVRNAENMGKWIDDDNGRGWPIGNELYMETYFIPVEPDDKDNKAILDAYLFTPVNPNKSNPDIENLNKNDENTP